MDWLDLAAGDLNVAYMCINNGKLPTERLAAAYHLQQAVEKILKYTLVFNGINPPFIHNIAKLLVLINKTNFKVSNSIVMRAAVFTYWEANTRYPTMSAPNITELKSSYNVIYTLLKRVVKYTGYNLCIPVKSF